ncbi:MAG TPA: RNA methyltransferase [Methanotrichaceae archaeon]|nr:RNA methyltransferase [Methanotrichaceae archaeon]
MDLRVVLVEPMYDGNIGSIARAMKNFGFSNLVLVNPCQIDDFGLAMASHAKDILAGARTATTLEEALEGADLVVGTTGKRLGDEQRHLRLHLRVPCFTPSQLAVKLQGKEGEIALLLGREDVGLTNEELMACDMVVSIPTSDTYPIMNISHAAAVLLYELSGLNGGETRLASRDSLLILQNKAREILLETRYPDHKAEFTLLMLRRIFGRAGLTEREVNTILGVLKNIKWMLDRRS